MVSRTDNEYSLSHYSIKSYLINTYYSESAQTDVCLNKKITLLLKQQQGNNTRLESIKYMAFKYIMNELLGKEKVEQVLNGKASIQQKDFREEDEGAGIYNYLMKYYAQEVLDYIEKKSTNQELDWEEEYSTEEFFNIKIFYHLIGLDQENIDDPLYLGSLLNSLSKNPIEYFPIISLLLHRANQSDLKLFLLKRIPNITNMEKLFISRLESLNYQIKLKFRILYNILNSKTICTKEWMLEAGYDKKDVEIAYAKDMELKENEETKKKKEENLNEVYKMAEDQEKKKKKAKDKIQQQKVQKVQNRIEKEEQEIKEKEEQEIKEKEEQARKEKEEQARKEKEEQARKEKEEQARKEKEEQARKEKEEQARKEEEEEEQARKEEEQQARKEKEKEKKEQSQNIKEGENEAVVLADLMNRMKKMETKHETDIKKMETKHETDIKKMETKHETDIKKMETKHETDIKKLQIQIDNHQIRFDKMTIRSVLINISRYLEEEKLTLTNTTKQSEYASFINLLYAYKEQLNVEIHTPPKNLLEVVQLSINQIFINDKQYLSSIFTSLIPMFENQDFIDYIKSLHWKSHIDKRKYIEIKRCTAKVLKC